MGSLSGRLLGRFLSSVLGSLVGSLSDKKNNTMKNNLQYFYSDIGGTPVKGPRMESPSMQTVQQARILGRVAVGTADIIYKNEGNSGEYIVVIQDGESMRYRDMYRLV